MTTGAEIHNDPVSAMSEEEPGNPGKVKGRCVHEPR